MAVAGSGPGDAISVVHLVWRPLGPAVLADFLAAYHRHPAGVAHRLVIVFNGFAPDDDRAPYETLLADTAHDSLVLPAPVQDLPAYLAAARALASEYLCFLNSYSAPLAPGWLAALYTHATRPGVGMVGASGSWESHYSNAVRLLPSPPRAAAHWVLGRFRAPDRRYTIDTYVQQRRRVGEMERLYNPFPSPHLRTNAFMLRRELMLSLRWPSIQMKEDAYAFESGREGLTSQVTARGLKVLIVGRDGRAFEPADWARSATFRCGGQANLLVADNRTREYDAFDEATRARVSWSTWRGADAGATTGSTGLARAAGAWSSVGRS